MYGPGHSVWRGQIEAGGAVAVAASAGGVSALGQFLSQLPRGFPVPVFVVQHLSRYRRSHLREVLQRRTPLRVVWAEDCDSPEPGTVYLAPPNRHISIRSDGMLSVDAGPLVHRVRPAANVLFHSVASYFGSRAIGVILTGCLDDGAEGAQAIRQAGGRIFVQDPYSCEQSAMPLAAMRTGAVDFCLSMRALSSLVIAITMVRGAAALFTVGDIHRRSLAEQAMLTPYNGNVRQ